MSNLEATDKAEMAEVTEGPPLTKSTDSDACIDEIECFPKHHDCRNNSAVSESYSKFEQDLIAIYMKDLQIKQLSADQHIKLVQQQTHMTQEQYDNKLAIAKLMIKQMNHHHHLQEQKYMLEIQTLRELFNLSEKQWNARINAVDEQLRQQQSHHSQIISELKDEIKQYNAQNQKHAVESQKSASNFDSARLELNSLIESNQVIVQTLESKIDKQSNDLFAFRADTTADKEEMELMVQSWMTQCEVLQQQVQDLQKELTSTKENVEEVSTMHDEIKASVEKMGQTYENVLENVMEQIQEQADLQSASHAQVQATQKQLEQGIEEVKTTTCEKFSQIDKCASSHEEKIGSLEEASEKVNGAVNALRDGLHDTNDQVAQCKEAMTVQSAAQATTQSDVTGLQSIVAKLADATNNRFVRMETAFEHEIKSVKEIKEEMIVMSENNQERVKVVDNKIVIHSIQLGEMSKDIKDMNVTISSMKDDHQKAFLSVQNECKEISKLVETQNGGQSQVNEDILKSITSLQASSKGVELRTSTIEKCIDTMTVRMDQFHEDHTLTRGNFMEQHQNMETTVTEQLQALTQKISDIQQTTQVDVRNVTESFDMQIKGHQDKLDEHQSVLKKLNANAVLTIQKHEASEANVALLQADVRDIKQNIQKMDQTHALRLNEHINFAKSKLQQITDVAIPDQQKLNTLLRENIADVESKMKEEHKNSQMEMSDRVSQLHSSITTMNNTIDELSKVQEGSKTDFVEMKQRIEKIVADLSAVNDACTSEVAHRSELQTKLFEVDSSLQIQSAKACEIESALDSHVTAYHEAQEQSKSELNHSLAQVLTLSQMKEAMMNQIADCLVRLTVLDTSKAEHSKKIKEIAMEIADHDTQIQTLREGSRAKLLETESSLESYRVALDALKYDVQKQREVQKGVNDYVSESVATCTVSISEIEKRATSVNAHLDVVTQNLHDHISSSDTEIAKMCTLLDQHDKKQQDIETKISETEHSMREEHTRISKDVKKTQALANDLKSSIDRHSDRLKTAKDARVVMRNDLKTMVDSMNEQLETVRKQMNENTENFAKYLESMIQTRDEHFNKAHDDNETLSKIDFLAGRFKAMSENSKLVRETVVVLQDEINQWKDKTEQDVTSQIAEMTSKIDYLTGKFKAMNEKAKLTNQSIVQIQDDYANYKNHDNEETTELIEEISTKIDYLAGKFKALNDNVKSTNSAMSSLQDQVSQVTNRQLKDHEHLQEQLKEHDQNLTLTMRSMISEAVTKSLEGDHNDVYGKLLHEFNAMKADFEEMNAQRRVQETTRKMTQNDHETDTSKVEDMMKEIERISQKIQILESEQRIITVSPTKGDVPLVPASIVVDQLKADIDRLSRQIEQNIDEIGKAKMANELLATEVHGIYDRQTKYKKAIMKQHGELKEFVNVVPMKQKSLTGIITQIQRNEEETIYHEARDAEDVTSYSAPIEHREQE